MIPVAINGSNYVTHFCDYGCVGPTFNAGARRGYPAANSAGGVGCLYLYDTLSHAAVDVGSRLLYNGAVTEVDSL